MKQIRKRLTFANLVACLALFIALGGAAYAGTKLAKNSVGSKQLKKNAVTTAKIKNGAVTGAKIKNGSLTGAQINASSLGTVPNATSAANVNGVAVQRFFAQDPPGTVSHTIATVGGLTIQGACSAGNKPTLRATLNETSNALVDVYGNTVLGSEELAAGSFTSLTNSEVEFGGLGTADLIGYSSHTDYKIEWFVRDAEGGPLGSGDLCFYSGYVYST